MDFRNRPGHGAYRCETPGERIRHRHQGGWRHARHYHSVEIGVGGTGPMEAAVKLREYRAQQRFVIDDGSKVGEARRAAHTLANFEFDAEFAGKVAIAATELATNLLLQDRKSTRLNSSHSQISYAVFCLKK